MRIVFVVGPAFSGKSIYIEKEFPDAVKVNISTYNQTVYSAESNEEIEEIARNAQLYCMEELRRRILGAKEDDVIVLENQLLKKEGRKQFLSAVREVTDLPVECVVLAPSEEMVEKMLNYERSLIVFHAYEKGKLEMPSEEEGFCSVRIEAPEFREADLNTHR